MFRKITAGAVVMMLLVSLFSSNVAAAPYAEINITADGVSKIHATHFDTVYELRTDEPSGGRDIRPETEVGTEHGGNEFDFEGNVGWADQIYWLDWTINVEADAFYRFNAAIASYAGAGGIDLYLNGERIGESPDGKIGDGWQTYHWYTMADIHVTAGTHVLRAVFWEGGGINLAGFDVFQLNPYGFPVWSPVEHRITRMGTTTIRATDFDPTPYGKAGDDGAQQVREGHAVRTEGNGSEWGSNIGWIGEGDWVQFTSTFVADGVYNFVAAIASGADAPGGVRITVGDIEVGTSAAAPGNGWQEYELVPVGEAEIPAGEHVIRVEFPDGGLNFAALQINRTGDIPGDDEPDPPADVPDDNGADAPADAPADGNGEDGAANGDTPAATPTADDDGGNMVLWIIVAIVAVVIIVVIVVFAMKKKKPA